MKISSFTIKNFKGIGEEGITINFAPVTLLFGANNIGKSSVIQALFLAREIICNGNVNPDTVQGGGRTIKLGGFQNFVHNHNLNKSVILRFDINCTEEIIPVYDVSHYVGVITAYTRSFFSNNFSNIRNIGFEISVSWDKYMEIPYISNRKLYVNNILFLSIDTNAEQKNAIIDIINNIFDSKYDGGVIENKYIARKVYRAIRNNLDVFIGRSEAREIVYTIIKEQFDYNMYINCGIYVSKKTSMEAYAIIEKMIVLSLFGSNKFNINTFIDVIKNISDDCKELFNPQDDSEIEEFFSKIKNVDIKTYFDTFSDILDRIQSNKNFLQIDFDDKTIKGNAELFLKSDYPREIVDENLTELFFSPEEFLEEELNKLLYIGTQRVTIERHFNPETIQALTWANGMAAWQELMDNPELVDKVNCEIPKVLGPDFNVRLAHLKDVSIDMANFAARLTSLKKQSEQITPEHLTELLAEIGADMHNRVFFVNQSGTYLSPNDLGHGISQIIPILAAPLLPDNNANIVVIEEPESNIHPAWQVELAEFFLRVACKDNDNASESDASDGSNQSDEEQSKNKPPILLLETHSEHIMLRILRRIRETHNKELPPGAQSTYPKDVAVHYIQRGNDGNTQVTFMEVTPDGDFCHRWPKGFFEERAEELF